MKVNMLKTLSIDFRNFYHSYYGVNKFVLST
jgi:hypothetical protein